MLMVVLCLYWDLCPRDDDSVVCRMLLDDDNRDGRTPFLEKVVEVSYRKVCLGNRCEEEHRHQLP